LAALQKLNATDLLERFLRDVVTPSYDGSENEALLACADVLAGAQTAAVLSNLVSAQMRERPLECSELLLALSKSASLCFPEVAEAEVAGLDSIGGRDAETESPDSEAEDLDWEPEDRQRHLGPEFLENLLRALPRFGDGRLCREDRLTSRCLQSRDAGRSRCGADLCGVRQGNGGGRKQRSAPVDRRGGVPAPA
jgi:hypothetical protein